MRMFILNAHVLRFCDPAYWKRKIKKRNKMHQHLDFFFHLYWIVESNPNSVCFGFKQHYAVMPFLLPYNCRKHEECIGVHTLLDFLRLLFTRIYYVWMPPLPVAETSSRKKVLNCASAVRTCVPFSKDICKPYR